MTAVPPASTGPEEVVPPPSRPNRLTRWLLVIGAVLLLAVGVGRCVVVPGEGLEDGEGITGTYVVNGVDPLEVEYSGTVTIVRQDDGLYTITWIVTGTVQEGVGELVGDRLTVEWRTLTSARGESTGTAVYEVGDDGVLRGTRTVDGVDEVGTEEIFPEP